MKKGSPSHNSAKNYKIELYWTQNQNFYSWNSHKILSRLKAAMAIKQNLINRRNIVLGQYGCLKPASFIVWSVFEDFLSGTIL